MRVTYGSLFTGIGGLDLGVEMALRELGIDVECAWQVEQDPFCRAVLEKHWPAVNRTITDVRFAGTASLIRVGLVIGGFPCQDVSGAGKGEGLEGARSGLWFEFKRIVKELAPPLVIVENVASGKKRWLCQVRSDLHSLGYRTRAIQVSAADVGAPHLRERVFVIAMADPDCLRRPQPEGGEREQWRRAGNGGKSGHVDGGRVGDANAEGREGAIGRVSRNDVAPESSGRFGQAQSGLGGDAPRLSGRLDSHRWPAPRGAAQYEGEPPRTVEGKQEHRRPRLKSLGNTVVPQCGRVAMLTLAEWSMTETRAAA